MDEIDRLIAPGMKCGGVLADVTYGSAAEFCRGLQERRWCYGVEILLASRFIRQASRCWNWKPRARDAWIRLA